MQSGIDSVNDGELSKSNFTDYVRAPHRRLRAAADGPAPPLEITARDATKFADYFERPIRARGFAPGTPMHAGLHREAALYRRRPI